MQDGGVAGGGPHLLQQLHELNSQGEVHSHSFSLHYLFYFSLFVFALFILFQLKFVQDQITARTKRGWSYPLEAVPAKFRSRRPKDAIRMTATGNTDAKVSLIVLSCVFVLFSLCLCLVAPLLRCLAQTLPRAGAPDDRPRSDVARARQRCRHR